MGVADVLGIGHGAVVVAVDEHGRVVDEYLLQSADYLGAAGGIGFAFLSYTNAILLPGVELVLRETKLEEYIRNADIVITGEGRLDAQTAMGKAPVGVARLAKKHGKPVIAFARSVTKDAATLNECGIDAYFPILQTVCSLDDAMNTEKAAENLSDTVEQVFRVIRAAEKLKDESI